MSTRTSLRSHAQVQPLAGVDRARVEAAHAAMYRWTHETWSPVRAGFEAALNEDLWDALDVDASAVTVDDLGRISALALTYRDSDPPRDTGSVMAKPSR